MEDQEKTKERLVGELAKARRRIAELEASEMSLRDTEAQLQRRVEEIALLNRVTTLTALAKDMTEALQRVCAELARFLQVSQSGFAILKPGHVAAEVIADYRPQGSSSAIGFIIPVADNPSMAHILEHKVPLAIVDAQTDPLLMPVHDIMRQRNVQSILLVPVLSGGEVIGTLGFDAFQRREFDRADIELIQHVANQMGQILMREQVEETLHEVEERYRRLVESSDDLIFSVDRAGVFRTAGGMRLREFGLRPADVVGKSLDDLFGEEAELYHKRHQQVFDSGEILTYEHAFEFAGITKTDLTTIYPIRDESGTVEMVGVICRDITERVRMEGRIKASLREKEVLLRELHHRTTNNMQVISAMLALQASHTKDERIVRVFQETENRIRSMALVHQKLLQSADLSSIDLKEYVSDLVNFLVASYGMRSDRISLILDVDSIPVLIDIAVPCGLILNELISNALKHAFPGDMKGEIRVRIGKTETGEMELQVSDDGVGVPQGFDFKSSDTLGLQNVFAIGQHQLQGEVVFEVQDGITCRIRFKDTLYSRRV
jgi:PAS domain S-box-containing protein